MHELGFSLLTQIVISKNAVNDQFCNNFKHNANNLSEIAL